MHWRVKPTMPAMPAERPARKNPAWAGFSVNAVRAASGGALQRLDPGAQAALVAGGLVAGGQATRTETVEQRLGGLEGLLGAGGIVGVERLDHLLHGGAELRALAGVALVAHDSLLGALLGRLDVGHGGILETWVGGTRAGAASGSWVGCEAAGKIPAALTSEPEIMGDSVTWVNTAGPAEARA